MVASLVAMIFQDTSPLIFDNIVILINQMYGNFNYFNRTYIQFSKDSMEFRASNNPFPVTVITSGCLF